MSGRTVLVTGASSGFGREFARLFAADGFDVALVARTGAALEELAQEVEMRHEVSAHVLPFDLARPSAPRQLVSELATRRVHVDALVNSAGFTRFGPFAESDERRMLELLQVNMTALTHLTRLVLPGMIGRGWGRIVNLSSNAAFQPGPLMADYYASKAYVLSLSIALSEELRGTGVRVTALCPGPTRMGFQRAAQMEDSRLVAGRDLPDAAEVAAWGYRQVKRGRPFAVQGARWQTAAFGTRFLPRTTAARIVARAQQRVANPSQDPETHG
jgi:short-subunit dehydrogenase